MAPPTNMGDQRSTKANPKIAGRSENSAGSKGLRVPIERHCWPSEGRMVNASGWGDGTSDPPAHEPRPKKPSWTKQLERSQFSCSDDQALQKR
jgi:hypothetical protein